MLKLPSQDVFSSRTKIVRMTPTLDDLFVSFLAIMPSTSSQALTNTPRNGLMT